MASLTSHWCLGPLAKEARRGARFECLQQDLIRAGCHEQGGSGCELEFGHEYGRSTPRADSNRAFPLHSSGRERVHSRRHTWSCPCGSAHRRRRP